MQMDGEQVLVINEFNKRTGFYQIWNAEADIRTMAKKHPNTFSVGIFACCREIFSTTRHCGLFGGTYEEALAHFKKMVTAEIEAKKTEESAAKQEALKQLIEHQAQKLSFVEAIEAKKYKKICKFT